MGLPEGREEMHEGWGGSEADLDGDLDGDSDENSGENGNVEVKTTSYDILGSMLTGVTSLQRTANI